MQDSEVVIKAFKEHERRNGVKQGFAYTPADALAFKYYRDVSPCSKLLCQQQSHMMQMHCYINSQAPAVCTCFKPCKTGIAFPMKLWELLILKT